MPVPGLGVAEADGAGEAAAVPLLSQVTVKLLPTSPGRHGHSGRLCLPGPAHRTVCAECRKLC